MNIFITGGSGCIGHYVVEALLADYPEAQLHLLCRDRKRFRLDVERPNITLHEGSMNTIGALSDVLYQMDYLVHIATEWGDADMTLHINIDQTKALFGCLDPERCQRIVYFSTASILGRDNRPIAAAGELGTPYIRSKYLAYEALRKLPLAEKMVTVFPTSVFGGDETHPYSHLSSGIPNSLSYLKILRWIYFDAGFHFMHGRDIAAVTSALLGGDGVPKDVVFGHPSLTEREALQCLCKVFRKPAIFQVKIPRRFIFFLTKLFRIKLTSWDRYCINNPHFLHTTTRPEDLGKTSRYPTLESILVDLKERKKEADLALQQD